MRLRKIVELASRRKNNDLASAHRRGWQHRCPSHPAWGTYEKCAAANPAGRLGPLAVARLPPGGDAASGLVLPSPPMRPHRSASLSAPSTMGLHAPVIPVVMADGADTRLPPLPLRDRPRGDPGTGRHRAAPTRAPPTRAPPPLRPHAGCPLGRNPLQFPDTPAEDRPAPHAWAIRARSPSITRAKRRTHFLGGGAASPGRWCAGN